MNNLINNALRIKMTTWSQKPTPPPQKKIVLLSTPQLGILYCKLLEQEEIHFQISVFIPSHVLTSFNTGVLLLSYITSLLEFQLLPYSISLEFNMQCFTKTKEQGITYFLPLAQWPHPE